MTETLNPGVDGSMIACHLLPFPTWQALRPSTVSAVAAIVPSSNSTMVFRCRIGTLAISRSGTWAGLSHPSWSASISPCAVPSWMAVPSFLRMIPTGWRLLSGNTTASPAGIHLPPSYSYVACMRSLPLPSVTVIVCPARVDAGPIVGSSSPIWARETSAIWVRMEMLSTVVGSVRPSFAVSSSEHPVAAVPSASMAR